MRVLFFFAALGFAIVGMSGVTLSLLNLIDESQTGGWPLWQSLIMTAVGVAGFLFCLIKVIRGVREETPPADQEGALAASANEQKVVEITEVTVVQVRSTTTRSE
ncbi:MAG: hypothetical protein ACOY7P_10500 [Pseudomonadota bacterium]